MRQPLRRPAGQVRVLAIDDQITMLVAHVERFGFDDIATVEAETFEEAVDAFTAHRATIEVVVMDCFFRRDGEPGEGNIKDSQSGVLFARWLYGEAGFTGTLVASCSRAAIRGQLEQIAGAQRCVVAGRGGATTDAVIAALKPQQGR